MPSEETSPDLPDALLLSTLLHLSRRARHAADMAELGFVAVNETHALTPYRQAALWLADRGVITLSGVVSVEANVPYVQWLAAVSACVDASAATDRLAPRRVIAGELPDGLAADWSTWLPARAVWVPLAGLGADGAAPRGGLLLVREMPWRDAEMTLLAEWGDILAHAVCQQLRPSVRSRGLRVMRGVAAAWAGLSGGFGACWQSRRCLLKVRQWRVWRARGQRRLRALAAGLCRPREWGAVLVATCRDLWRRPGRRYGLLLLGVLLCPVRLTVLAPGELVPAKPAVIRAPLDGSVDRFFVAPNSRVKAGDPLFQLDLTALAARLAVAQQGQATAEAEYRQAAQQAVFEDKSKLQLALLQGRIGERRAEVDYLQSQLARAQVAAPQDGVVLMDDPGEWEGKPVTTGERIMTVAAEQDVEIEAWVALGDGIVLPAEAPVILYLNAEPLSPVTARLRYYAHDAVARPDGSFAYRLRARLAPGERPPRVGMKGTAKIKGAWVTLAYWVARRPLAILRQAVGL